MSDLPEGWDEARLPLIADLIMGQSPPGSTYNSDGKGLPFFQGKAEFGERHPVARKWCSAPGKVAEPGDILISVRAPVGPTNVADRRCAIGRGLAAIRISDGVLPDWILSGLRLQEQEIAAKGTGSTFTAISSSDLAEITFVLPPLAEQRRIVEKVEALLADVNAARERLAKVPALLERFRQSVLMAACSGQLTRDFSDREDGQEGAERTVTDGLSPIPSGWSWATLDELRDPQRPIIYGIIKPGPHVPDGVPYVRVNEMKDGLIDVGSLRRASPERARKFSRATLRAGDILISKDGTVGRVAVVPKALEGGNITQHLVRFSPSPENSTAYLVIAIRSPGAQKWLEGAKKGVALQGVNVEDFRRLPLPLPTPNEQGEVVSRVDALFALADAIEARVAAATARVDKITQSILAKAFRGELVSTEAELARRDGRDYEPASVLLDRIRAKHERGAPNRVTRKRRRAVRN